MNYVGALAQVPMATVEIAGRSFDELAAHTWTTVLEASRHGRYDTVSRDAMDELIEHERGLLFNYGPMFNSLVPESWSGLTAGVGFQPEETDAALARTELRWHPMAVNGMPIRFTLSQIDGCLRLDLWNGDTGLADHPAAITPRYYVICGAAPADPADPGAWPTPLAADTGRAVTR